MPLVYIRRSFNSCRVIEKPNIIQSLVYETTAFHFTCTFVSFLLCSGVVFPYTPLVTRYNLNFDDAVQACQKQNASVATFDQLFDAWKGGLDWCNAGWLSDGTVQYPINNPRGPCGGTNNGPGLRSYGRRDKQISRFDVFCFSSALTGKFFLFVNHSLILIHFVFVVPTPENT